MPGKNNAPLLIVDADALIAFVVTNEINHLRAKTIMKHVALSQGTLIYPSTAICEAVTVLRAKLNNPDAASSIMQKFQTGDLPVQAVDQDTITQAAKLFNPLASKKNTLFDAVVAAIAKKLNADAIFSFDGWYGKIGLTLASDLTEQFRKAA